MKLTRCVLIILLAVSGDAHATEATADCKKLAATIKPGISRTEVENVMKPDGGISVPYSEEFYYFISSVENNNNIVCKMRITFRPYNISNLIYNNPENFRNWRISHNGSSRDVIIEVSDPYMEYIGTD